MSGLFVSTTGTSVEIPELGITIVHPTTERELSTQFNSSEIKRATTLTGKIRDGTLQWKKTSGGPVEPAADYDDDYLHADEANTGPGLQNDRVVTFKDLGSSTISTKSGVVSPGSFSGTPKKATVTFSNPFPDTNYSLSILGSDARAWSYESLTAGSFVINSNANQALSSNVHWLAIKIGETS